MPRSLQSAVSDELQYSPFFPNTVNKNHVQVHGKLTGDAISELFQANSRELVHDLCCGVSYKKDNAMSAEPHIIYNKYSHSQCTIRTSMHAYNRTNHTINQNTINQNTAINTTPSNPISQSSPIRFSIHFLLIPIPELTLRWRHSFHIIKAIQSNPIQPITTIHPINPSNSNTVRWPHTR